MSSQAPHVSRVPGETLLDERFSSPEAEAVPWETACRALAGTELYWLTTVRPDGRPHMTPLMGVWDDDTLHFTTGPDERKARNLAADARCVLATGNGVYAEGLDLVVEGAAVRVTDEERLAALAGLWVEKYGEDWRFAVRDAAFQNPHGGRSLVFGVAPETAFGFAKGVFGQTRWRRFGTLR